MADRKKGSPKKGGPGKGTSSDSNDGSTPPRRQTRSRPRRDRTSSQNIVDDVKKHLKNMSRFFRNYGKMRVFQALFGAPQLQSPPPQPQGRNAGAPNRQPPEQAASRAGLRPEDNFPMPGARESKQAASGGGGARPKTKNVQSVPKGSKSAAGPSTARDDYYSTSASDSDETTLSPDELYAIVVEIRRSRGGTINNPAPLSNPVPVTCQPPFSNPASLPDADSYCNLPPPFSDPDYFRRLAESQGFMYDPKPFETLDFLLRREPLTDPDRMDLFYPDRAPLMNPDRAPLMDTEQSTDPGQSTEQSTDPGQSTDPESSTDPEQSTDPESSTDPDATSLSSDPE